MLGTAPQPLNLGGASVMNGTDRQAGVQRVQRIRTASR
jgi:hypothetical protein